MNRKSQPHESDESAPGPVAVEYKYSHVTTGRYLPTPGRMPGWPLADIGAWKMDVAASLDDWVREARDWRREHLQRLGYDDACYRRPETLWAQANFVQSVLMVEDRFFYDPVQREYTVDRYLDDLEARYGGVDSVVLWGIYPNIGVDDRNQDDLLLDLPGGEEGLREVVAAFHRRGVRVFLPVMPWDNGTRDAAVPEWQRVVELAARVGADGLHGDTYSGVPRAFAEAAEAAGHPLVLEPETTVSASEHLLWNVQSWSKKAPDTAVPPVFKWKWLEPRHLVHYENRWGRERTHDLQCIFFNGCGYVTWENVWGIWNGFTERDAECLRRIALLFRRCAPMLAAPDWRPYAPTLRQGVFASCFPTPAGTLWTLVNRNEYALDGAQLRVRAAAGSSFFDAWNGVPLAARADGEEFVLDFALEGRGFGAVLAFAPGSEPTDLAAFLATMRGHAAKPLADLDARWRSLPQELVPIAPAPLTQPTPPAGMIRIPAGEFDFVVGGIEIEGFTNEGVDVQYPWEPSARRTHHHRLQMQEFFIDRCPVTNAEFAAFLAETGWKPADPHNFLRHWVDGRCPPGWANKPVTWVSLEDARAYAAWAGKRLPREWEWQYAAQGGDGRLHPWGSEWNPAAVPAPEYGRSLRPPADVDAHPAGASPFGVLDLVGNVWQWTDEYRDAHTRAAVVRGGSSWWPQGSHWYFPNTRRLDEHGKYLLMAPGRDRSARIGFRCAADLPA